MKKTIIVDVDDTITIVGDRRNTINKINTDYTEFHNRCLEDKPNGYVIRLLSNLLNQYNLLFVTIRPESIRNKTIKQIENFLPIVNPNVLMNDESINNSAATIKLNMIKNAIDIDTIEFALEDNDKVIKEYSKAGIKCLKVISQDKAIKPKRIRKKRRL